MGCTPPLTAPCSLPAPYLFTCATGHPLPALSPAGRGDMVGVAEPLHPTLPGPPPPNTSSGPPGMASPATSVSSGSASLVAGVRGATCPGEGQGQAVLGDVVVVGHRDVGGTHTRWGDTHTWGGPPPKPHQAPKVTLTGRLSLDGALQENEDDWPWHGPWGPRSPPPCPPCPPLSLTPMPGGRMRLPTVALSCSMVASALPAASRGCTGLMWT